jgi:type I restriction enzyme S subunit
MRFEKFSNIIEDNTSNYCKIKKEDYQPLGLFPIIDQGQVFIGGYTDDEKLIIKENLPVIIFGDHTKIFKYVDFPFTIGADGVKVLSLKNQSFNTKFYYYFLKTLRLTNAGYSRHFKYLKVCKLPIPDKVDDQLRIADILTKAENLIAKRKESIQLLDEFLKSTFLEMFGDPVRNEKDWETKTIEYFAKKKKYSLKRGPFGGSLKKEIFTPSGYLVYEQYHALNNDFSFERYYIDEKKFQELKAFEVAPDDIIISCSGVYLGKLAIVPKGAKKGIINQALLKITLDDKIINNHFFVFMFSHESFKNKFYGNFIGSGIPNFPSMNDFKKFKFIYPPLEFQIRFVRIVEKTEDLKAQYNRSLQELENLYGSLSQKAFRGELSFKDEGLMIAAEPEAPYSVHLLKDHSE